jgi:hypothetical protein
MWRAQALVVIAQRPSLAVSATSMSIKELHFAGRVLGETWRGYDRELFEDVLITNLSALDGAIRLRDLDADRALALLAAFDQAAWAAWEYEETEEPSVSTSSKSSGRLLVYLFRSIPRHLIQGWRHRSYEIPAIFRFDRRPRNKYHEERRY